MYICVDFDGTVVDHRYPYVGDSAPFAIDWLQRWVALGAQIILFTMRADDPEKGNLLQDAVDYFAKNNIPLYGVNRNPDQDSWTSSPKAYGKLYIDDSAFGCPLIHPATFNKPCVNWKKIGPAVEAILLNQ